MDLPDTCHRCNAELSHDGFPSRPFIVNITLESDSDPYREVDTEQRVLCSACELDLLKWIDEGEIDRSNCVDLPERQTVTNRIHYAIESFEKTLEELEDSN